MAVPAWAIANTTDVMLEPSTDGTFSAFGGGPAGLNDETDYFIQNAECASKNAWASALRGMMHDHNTVDLAVGTDEAVMVWQIYHVPNAIGANGMRVMVGTSTSVNWYFEVGDATSLLFETWVPWVVNFDNSLETGQNGSPSAAGTVDWVGGGVDVTANGPTKGSPFGIDAIRFGRFQLDWTGGETADYQTFAKAEAYSNANIRRYGIIEATSDGTYRVQGFHSLGTSGTLCDMRDSGQVIFIRDTPFVTPGFTRFEVINASSNIEWDNIIIKALGTGTDPRGVFVQTSGDILFTNCQFIGMDTFDFLAAVDADVTTCTFRACNEVTAPGTNLLGTKILEPTVAVNGAGLVWNVATDPDGLLDNMEFSQGANAHHAISFGSSTPTEITLTDIAFGTDWNATDETDGATLLFGDKGSDTDWIVNLSGCTGTISYDIVRGTDTVTFVIDPVTVEIEVLDITTQLPIEDAGVLLVAADGTGDMHYQQAITGAARTGGNLITVTHTSHGLATGDFVLLEGADTGEGYNGCHQITVTTANAYTYVVTGTNGSATGSLTITGAYFNSLTNASGIVTDTRSISLAQPVEGWVRKMDSSPFYKQSPINDEVSTTLGLSLTVSMLLDQ